MCLAAGVAALGAVAIAWPSQAAFPSITVTRIGKAEVVNGEAKTPVTDRTVTASGTAETVPSLVVDAGDSAFVAEGTAVPLRSYAVGGHGSHTFTWSLDGSQARFEQPSLAETTFRTDGLEDGTHRVQVTVTDESGRSATDTVAVVVYRPKTTRLVDAQDVEAGPGVPDEHPEGGDGEFVAGLIGAEPPATSGAVDGQSTPYPFTVPASATTLAATLSWTDPTNDFDVSVDDPSDREDKNTSAATGNHPETVEIDNPAAGDWSLTSHAYLVTSDTYDLVVDVTTAPADPRPLIDAPPVFAFDKDEPQRLHVDVSGGQAPVTVAWDLDNDGLFDASGTDVTAAAPPGTTLVTAKATDAAGFERRVMVGLRVSEGRTDASPLVVVGVIDSGINLYHEDFGAALYPDPAVLELTRDFTRHPAEYIDGFPTRTRALPITLGQGYLPPADASLFERANVPLGEMFWVPGTKVIGVSDGGDSDTVTDTVPILDENSHGTRSASVAVGNIFGYCPTCLLVFAEDINGDNAWMFDQPWIDIVSNSYGMESGAGSAGLPVVDQVFSDGQPKEAAERGQLALYAAGNGVQRFFIAPNQTYTSDLMSADWPIRVGAVDTETGKPIFGSGHPVDVSSYGFGYIPAADMGGTSAAKHNANHGGTSAATPYTSGAFGHVLREVRRALGDSGVGQRSSAPGVIAEGEPIAASAYLADGRLTATELTEAIFKTAAHDDTRHVYADYNGRVAASGPVAELALEGYGVVNQATASHALDVLLGQAPLPERVAEDAFMAADSALRVALWGDWAGAGDNRAASSQSAPSPNPFLGVTVADVASFDAALTLLAERAGPFVDAERLAAAQAMAEGDALTYYLHLTGSCAEGVNTMSLANSSGDIEPCTIVGGGLPLTTIDYPSEGNLPAAVPAGTPVSGTVYLKTMDPALVAVTATLSSGSTTVGSGSSDMFVTFGAADGALGLWNALPVTFNTTAPIAAGQPLTMSLAIDTSATVDIGYEADHASAFTLVGITGGGGGGGTPEGGDDHPVAEGYAASITSPAKDGVVEGDMATFTIAGGSVLPDRTAASAGINRFYPHWTEDLAGSCGNTFLDRDPAIPDSGCRSVTQPVTNTGVIGDALVELEVRESYPLVGSELPVTLGEGAATGTLYYRGDLQSASLEPAAEDTLVVPGISPAHQVTVEVRATHLGLEKIVGRQTIDGTILLDATAFAFDIPIPAAFAGLSYSALSLDVVTEQSLALARLERDDPQSYVDLPIAPTAEGMVVTVDDPTFVRPMRPMRAADGSWSVALPTSALANGKHTVYAKVVRGTAQSAVVSQPFTVQRQPKQRTVAVEVQAVPWGTPVNAAGWVLAVDTSSTGSFESWTVNLGDLPKGTYQLYSRVTIDGAVSATTGPISFRRR